MRRHSQEVPWAAMDIGLLPGLGLLWKSVLDIALIGVSALEGHPPQGCYSSGRSRGPELEAIAPCIGLRLFGDGPLPSPACLSPKASDMATRKPAPDPVHEGSPVGKPFAACTHRSTSPVDWGLYSGDSSTTRFAFPGCARAMPAWLARCRPWPKAAVWPISMSVPQQTH